MPLIVQPQVKNQAIQGLAQSLMQQSGPAYGVGGAVRNFASPVIAALMMKEQGKRQQKQKQAQASAMGRMLEAAQKARAAGQDPTAAVSQIMKENKGQPGYATAGSQLMQGFQQSLVKSLMQPVKDPKTVKDAAGYQRYLTGPKAGQRAFPGVEKPPAGGPFSGKSVEAQDSNIVLTGDPSSPEYALSYRRLFQEPRPQMTDRGLVYVAPPAPPSNIRPPTAAAAKQAAKKAGRAEVVSGTEKMPTAIERKAGSFAKRLKMANKVITRFETVGADPMGVIASRAPNLFKSGERQSLEQAERNFVNAILRPESGAVINPEEFENARKQYFPQPGDGPDVIEQKRENREIAVQNMMNESGRARPASEEPAASDGPPGKNAPRAVNPETGEVLILRGGKWVPE